MIATANRVAQLSANGINAIALTYALNGSAHRKHLYAIKIFI